MTDLAEELRKVMVRCVFTMSRRVVDALLAVVIVATPIAANAAAPSPEDIYGLPPHLRDRPVTILELMFGSLLLAAGLSALLLTGMIVIFLRDRS